MVPATVRLVCGFFIALFWLSCVLPVSAGELMFTPADQKRQAAFMAAMDRAVAAAQKGDRATVRTAIREAVRHGGFSFTGMQAAACGQSALQIPSWLIPLQVALGDAEGAKISARNLTSASSSLYAFLEIGYSQAQATKLGTQPLTFEEVRRKASATHGFASAEDFLYIKHDYSTLKRYWGKPDHTAGRQTLRQAAAYADAVDRANRRPQEDYPGLPGSARFEVARALVHAGDIPGARTVLLEIRDPANRAFTLFQLANELQKLPQEMTRTREEAERQLTLVTNLRDRAIALNTIAALFNPRFVSQPGRMLSEQDKLKGKSYLREGVACAAKVPDPAFQCQYFFVVAVNQGESQDKAGMRRTIQLWKTAAQKIPQLTMRQPAHMGMTNQGRIDILLNITSTEMIDLKDKNAARATLAQAEALVPQITDAKTREQYERIIASYNDRVLSQR